MRLQAVLVLLLVVMYPAAATAASIHIDPGAPSLDSGKAGSSYVQTFTATGGSGNYSFVVSDGSLPNGLSLSSGGVLSGTPTTYDNYNFTIRANDDQGNSGARSYTLLVHPNITVSPATLTPATAGIFYSQQIQVTGAKQPYNFALHSGLLPDGMTLSSSGMLSGIPGERGTYSFRVVVNLNVKNGAFYEYQMYMLDVSVPAPAAHDVALNVAYNSDAVSVPLNITGGTPVSLAVASNPANGVATPNGIAISYKPQPGFFGVDTFTYTATNSSGTSMPARVTVTVNRPAPPIAQDLAFEIKPEDARLDFRLEATGAGPFQFGLVAQPLHYQSFSFNTDGTASYSPKRNSDGSPSAATDNFTYQVMGPGGASNTAHVAITILNKPAPVAADDTASTLANQAVTIPVTSNDSGSIGGVAIATAPAHGTATPSGLSVLYSPAVDFFGTDTFAYSATGPGGVSAPATVTVIVSPLQVPTATGHIATTLPGVPVTIDVAVGATGGPFTTASIVNAPATGTAAVSGTSITYTPAENSPGDVNFSYTLSNPFGMSQPAIISVIINPKPMAAEQSITTIAGVPVTVNLTEGATGGPFTGATLVSLNPSSAGMARIENGAGSDYQLTFAPAPTFTGTVVARYTLRNAYTTSALANVTITVMARADPSKDPEVIGLVNAQVEGARRFADAQLTNYGDRLRQLRRSAGNESNQGVSLNSNQDDNEARDKRDRRDMDPLGFFSEPRRTRVAELAAGIIHDKSVPSRFGVWTAGQVDVGDKRSNGSGLDFTTSGVSAGIDYRFNERFSAGIGVGYGKDRTDIGNKGTRSDGESWSMGTYASWRPVKNTYFEAILGYGALSFDSKRYVTDAGGFASGSRDGQQVFGSLKVGYEIKREALYFSPYAGIDASWTKLGSFGEKGGGINNLHFGDQTVNSLVTVIGFETDYTYLFSGYRLTPNLKAEWRYDLSGESDASLNYIDWTGGPSFRLASDVALRNAVRLGLGVDAVFDQGLNFGLGYTTTLGEGGVIRHGFNTKIAMRF